MRIERKVALASLLLSVMLASAVAGAEGGTRPQGAEGRWKVTLTPNEKNALPGTNQAYEDELAFVRGTFTSQVNQKQGFAAATGVAGEKGSVTVEQKSDQHGVARWELSVQGDTIAGRLTWTKSSKKALFEVRGTRIP
ncbi:MAG: hypothetical protein HS116_15510 [Planctomycetes bacterium]|nr:hypothetical protein [Planctomycetota bacterium]